MSATRRPQLGGAWSHLMVTTAAQSAEHCAQCTHQHAGKSDALHVQGLRLRRELRDDDLVLGVYEEVLAVNAKAEEHRALTALHVPLRPVVDGHAWVVRSEV